MDRVTTPEQSVMPKNPVIIVHALAGDLLMMSPTLRFFAHHVGDTVRLICGVEKNTQDLLRQIGFKQLVATTFSVEEIVTDEHGERTYWTCETEPVRAALEGADLVINLLEFTGDSLASVIAGKATNNATTPTNRLAGRPTANRLSAGADRDNIPMTRLRHSSRNPTGSASNSPDRNA